MKKYFYILLFSVLTITACDVLDSSGDGNINWQSGGVVSSDNDADIPETIKTLLKMDAEMLVFIDLTSDPNLKETQVDLPINDVEKYYRGLVRIYNVRNYQPLNKIYVNRSIHTFQYRSLVKLSVGIDTTFGWTQAWKNGQRLTGNPDIDNLLETYNLTLSSSYYNFVLLTSDKSYNLFALGNKFKNVEGVFWSEPDGLVGDGNNVFAKTLNDGSLYFIYRAAWGDCPSGCISSHYWDVLVSNDGKVKFIKEYGAPLE